MHKILEILAHAILLNLNGANTLFGEEEAAKEQGDAHNGEARHGLGPCRLLCLDGRTLHTPEILHDLHEEEERGETTKVGERHTESREHITILRVGTHDTEQGGVWHVDGRVYNHHQRIRHESVDHLGGMPHLGRGEGQYANDAKRHGKP